MCNLIHKLIKPYNAITIGSKGKIFGHILTDNNICSRAICDRVNKGGADWWGIRETCVANNIINTHIKLNF